jgi:hypothetical protein
VQVEQHAKQANSKRSVHQSKKSEAERPLIIVFICGSRVTKSHGLGSNLIAFEMIEGSQKVLTVRKLASDWRRQYAVCIAFQVLENAQRLYESVCFDSENSVILESTL